VLLLLLLRHKLGTAFVDDENCKQNLRPGPEKQNCQEKSKILVWETARRETANGKVTRELQHKMTPKGTMTVQTYLNVNSVRTEHELHSLIEGGPHSAQHNVRLTETCAVARECRNTTRQPRALIPTRRNQSRKVETIVLKLVINVEIPTSMFKNITNFCS
jgi:hypothetical protein